MCFKYGSSEMEYLKKKDKKLGNVIDKIGHIKRETIDDLFSALVHSIIGQQISTKAHNTIWERFKDGLGEINEETILDAGRERIQELGITFRKADYIISIAEKVKSGDLDIDRIHTLSDEEVIKELTKLKGVGIWTAEMILIFCLQRPNVLSYGDLAIIRGLTSLYNLQEIDKNTFELYRKRFSPYCSVASLYLWEIAGGGI